MPLTPAIFKAYDIRGLSPQQLDADGAYAIGQAIAKFIKAKQVIVGRDMRGTSPELSDAVIRGLMSQGASVVDVGMVTTPMLYWAVGNAATWTKSTEGLGGVMVTASHNPSEYNGIKMCTGDVLPIGAATGMNQIRDLATAGPYEPTPESATATRREYDIRQNYIDALMRRINECNVAPMSVVVDTANGMEGSIVADILARCKNVTWHGLFLEPDGTFPNHEANPLNHETLRDLQKEVMERKADVGFAFDGDGDRVGIIDEKGGIVSGDLIVAFIAGEILKTHHGGIVLYDQVSSRIVPEYVRECGGRPMISKVGHGFIKPQMASTGAIFAGELSNHFYFGEMNNAESSDLVMLMVLQILGKTGKPLSELIAPLRKYVHSGEQNFTVSDKEAVFAKLQKTYAEKASHITDIDGVRMEFFNTIAPEGDWWFSVRASNTEPLLRLNLEARTKEEMEKRKAELSAIITG
jgi:phosphomannomutase